MPHSGSRSLLRHLGEPFISTENLWHFGFHDHLIRAYTGKYHLPVRNPIDILASWINRNKDPVDCIRCMHKMLEFYDEDPSLGTVWRTEDLPQHVGKKEYGRRTTRKEAELVWEDLALPELRQFYLTYHYNA